MTREYTLSSLLQDQHAFRCTLFSLAACGSRTEPALNLRCRILYSFDAALDIFLEMFKLITFDIDHFYIVYNNKDDMNNYFLFVIIFIFISFCLHSYLSVGFLPTQFFPLNSFCSNKDSPPLI